MEASQLKVLQREMNSGQQIKSTWPDNGPLDSSGPSLMSLVLKVKEFGVVF